MSRVSRADRFQRRHKWLGLPLGVIYKLFDDRGPYLAALITYYAFVSLFPLLLLSFSITGFVLQGHTELRQDLEQAALKKLPGLGEQLHIGTFHGSGLALVVGVLGTLYGALGAMQAAQASLNQIYGVPRNKQPNPIKSRLRSLVLVALLGSGVLLSTGIAAVLATANDLSKGLDPAIQVGGFIVNYGLNFVLFSTAYRLLTAVELRLRQVMPGALIAAALQLLIQIFGSKFVSHTAKVSLYGSVAVVLGTLIWMYLQSLVLIVAAEINVVSERRLWPRSLLTPFTDRVELTDADRRVYTMYAKTQRFKGFERVTTDFGDGPKVAPPPAEPEARPHPEPDARPRAEPDARPRAEPQANRHAVPEPGPPAGTESDETIARD